MPKGVQAAKLVMDTKGQTREQVVKAIEHILKRGGCPNCGLLSIIKVDFMQKAAKELSNVNSLSLYK